MVKSRGKHSWVTSCVAREEGPRVCRRRVRVWVKAVKREGVRNGLYAFLWSCQQSIHETISRSARTSKTEGLPRVFLLEGR